MKPLLPIIPISDLQRSAKRSLRSVQDYAVVQSHHRDIAFVLHPRLGKVLLTSGMLEELGRIAGNSDHNLAATGKELEKLIGSVLRELSKK
jgi:hypothetical protein